MMKRPLTRCLAVTALMLPLGLQAQSLTDFQDLSPEEQRAYWDSMSDEERNAKREQWRAERDAMSEEDRAAMREQMRARRDAMSDEERAAMRARRDAMRATNPAFVPRNHLVEEAIRAAVDEADYTPFEELMTVLAKPFEDQPARARYSEPPRPEDVVHQTFCGT